MISMDKQYRTRDGRKVRVLCVDRVGNYPVVALLGDGESLFTFTAEGKHFPESGKHYLDLVEHPPAPDWPINHPIWVRDFDFETWHPRHFAKYEDGRVYTWEDGRTSHTTQYTSHWDQGTDVNPNQEK